MKRLIAIGLMLASAFALTNCVEELGIPNIQDEQLPNDETTTTETEGVPFKIYASLESAVDTKTVGVKEGNTLKTQWVEGDKIIGIYEKDNVCGEPVEFTIDAQNLSAGEFLGTIPAEVLNDKESKYNWYFIYGPAGYSVTNGTATVTINIPTDQSQDLEKPVAHIGGINCPMFGQALNLSGPIFPRVQMKHLATLHEVTVRNDTKANQISGAIAGEIVVYDLGMSIATTGVWDKSNRLSLAGTFTLDLKSGKLKNYSGNKESIRLALPENGVPIDPGTTDNAHAFYFVTAPIESLQTNATYIKYYQKINNQANGPGIITQSAYEALPDKSTYKDVTTETLKLYKNKGNANDIKTEAEFNALSETEKANYAEFSTPEIDRQDIFTFSVNGSARTVQTNKTYDGFDGGKIKRFILPVREMQYPLASDALAIKSSGREGIGYKVNEGSWLRPNYVHYPDLTYKEVDVVKFTNYTTLSTTINGTPHTVYSFAGSSAESGAGSIKLEGWAKDMINALPVGFCASQWNNLPTQISLDCVNLWLPEYEEVDGQRDYTKLKTRHKLADASIDVPVHSVIGDFELSIPVSALSSVLEADFSNGITTELLMKQFGIPEETVTFKGMVPNGKNDKLLIMDENPVYKDMGVDKVNWFLSKFSTKTHKCTVEGLSAILNADMNPETGALIFPDEDAQTAAENAANAIIGRIQEILGDREIEILRNKVVFKEVICPGFFKSATDFMHQLRDMKFELVVKTTSANPIVLWGFDAWGHQDETKPKQNQ